MPLATPWVVSCYMQCCLKMVMLTYLIYTKIFYEDRCFYEEIIGSLKNLVYVPHVLHALNFCFRNLKNIALLMC